MAKRLLSGFIIFFIFTALTRAEDLQINPSHPDQYTVVKGDTLWDIAAKFLNHPWQWPELWKNNSQISNPHWIYPGDTIYFSVVNGRAQLSLSRPGPVDSGSSSGPCVLKEEDLKGGRKDFPTSEDGKLLPCIRETNIKQAIELIPNDAIAKYLSSPRVVGAEELSHSPYVLGFAGEHLIGGVGDKVFVRGMIPSDNLLYTIYRSGATYVSPETGEILGYEAKYIADARFELAGDPATLAISKANEEIRMGDRLMLNAQEDVTLNYFPKPPEQKITGHIISVLGGVSQIGRYDVVVIDKGSKDGMQVGHELDIYKRGKLTLDPFSETKNDMIRLPDQIAGSLMIFRPFERVSYALVMKAGQAIHISDTVQTP